MSNDDIKSLLATSDHPPDLFREPRCEPEPAKPIANDCESCRFWQRSGPNDPQAGECRRYAPAIGPTGGGRFPLMLADGWCGEHQFRRRSWPMHAKKPRK